jgi:vacuolar protein sorting-associated protein 41
MSSSLSPSNPSNPREEGGDPPVEAEQHDNDDDADEDEEEEEPQLKYERIGGDIAKVVKGDLVSTFCVGSKLIVLLILHYITPD